MHTIEQSRGEESNETTNRAAGVPAVTVEAEEDAKFIPSRGFDGVTEKLRVVVRVFDGRKSTPSS